MPLHPCAFAITLRNAQTSLSVALAVLFGLAATASYAQAASAPIEVRNAQGQLAKAAPAWRAPGAARLQFTVQGKYKNMPYQTKAQIDWQPQGQRYEAAQEVKIPIVGSRRQSSVGSIGPSGLLPEMFMDRGRKENSTTFDAQAGQILFSKGNTPATWVSGTQDRMSVFFQVAGMIAAAPQRYPQGTTITIQAASSSRVAPWTFTVRGTENLQLPAGRMSALKLEHSSDSSTEDHVQSDLWLAPGLQYLPVRIRMQEDGGRDELDLKLQSHSKL